METELCVIQTPRSDDAYTLFEVLNDRSSPLSDLDLIKNQFYKKIVDQRSIKSETLSEILEKLDTQWSEKIFKDASDIKTQTISYLAGTFLTKNHKVTHGEPFRKSLQDFLKTVVPFGEKDAQKIFNVYEGVTIFIDVFEIDFSSSRLKKSIHVEFDQNKSHICKVVHLLVALKQYGVLAGIFCALLREIKKAVPDLVPSNVKDELEKVCNSGLIKGSQYEKINDAALDMWSLVLASKDYLAPREYAVELINDNYYSSAKANIRPRKINSEDIKALSDWLQPWTFSKQKTNNLKVKMLLARLIQFQINANNDLEQYNFSITTIEALELDHMEPQKIEPSHENHYFNPKLDRDYFVDGLGNMMLLPATINKSKGNNPMHTTTKELETSGLKDCWLTLNIVELLNKHHKDVDTYQIPKSKFFDERKQYLLTRIKELLQLGKY